jgi:DNA-binding NarL/FixJ family response regulator
MKPTVLVADDHLIFRKGVIGMLHEAGNLEIIAELDNGLQAHQSIREKRPDIAILDIDMPGLTGLDVCRKAMSEKSGTKFIILTMHSDKSFFNDAMYLGVMGFLLKDQAASELVRCIDAVLKGERFVSPGIESRLLFSERNAVPGLAQLTSTEKAILKLIAETKTAAEIAPLLFVSPDMINDHQSNMIKKLGIEKQNPLMEFAVLYKHLL